MTHGRIVLSIVVTAAVLARGSADAQKPKPPQKNTTKTQGQLAGANGQFGVVYSLKNNFNFNILRAWYTLDPFIGHGLPTAARTSSSL